MRASGDGVGARTPDEYDGSALLLDTAKDVKPDATALEDLKNGDKRYIFKIMIPQ